jgi:hypothetical protein
MLTTRKDLIGQQVIDAFLPSSLCVFLSEYGLHQMKTGFLGEKQVRNPLASLLAAPLVDVPYAILCKMSAFSFSIKIDQHN